MRPYAEVFNNIKEKDYDEVEAVVGHKEVYAKEGGKTIKIRQFKVKWLGFDNSQNTWHDEKFLHGCLDLVQNYCLKHNLPLSDIEGTMGADITDINVNERI